VSRDLTEPESLVWAAAFVASLERQDVGLITENVQERALKKAWLAVQLLRNVRLKGRDEQPMIRMLMDFRMGKDQ
jgi:hypothetical protein